MHSWTRFASLLAVAGICIWMAGFAHFAAAQTYKDVDLNGELNSLPHEMTPEEEAMRDLIGKDALITPPPAAQPIRAHSEFERMKGCFVRYPLGISVSIVAEISQDALVYCIVTASQQPQAYSAFQSGGVNMANVIWFNATTDSYWVRDYGPWFIYDANEEIGVVDPIYNRPRPNDDAIPTLFANWMGWDVYQPNLIHTGGNWMEDGRDIAASTTLVYEENPGLTQQEVAQIVHDYEGIETYHARPDVNGEYIEHIDCWAKFLSPDKILIREVPPTHTQYDEIEAAVDYFENQISGYGWPYQIVRVWTPGNEPYTNSLILNNKVFVPIMGGSHPDAQALAAYAAAMPGYEVLGFTGTWESTDALHCRARGVADPGLLYVWSIPLRDTANDDTPYPVDAHIIDHSQAGLIANQLRVYWRAGTSGPFNYAVMTSLGDDWYQGEIPPQSLGTTVQYYVYAADNSGRQDTYPLVGSAGPFTFEVQTDTVPPVVSNTTDLRSTDDTTGPYVVETTVTDNFSVADVELHYRVSGGEFQIAPMTEQGRGIYAGGIPGQTYTTFVEYFVYAVDHGENEVFDPPNAPMSLYDFYVAPSSDLLFADMEGGSTWTHSPVTAGFGDQWHLSTRRNHTPGGMQSWKCGDTASGTYATRLDAGLVTEEFTLAVDSRLTYWQWVDAETSAVYAGYAYDGGLVEINTGSGWEQITPDGGYPFLIRTSANPGPFPAGTPVFSGRRNWQQVTFDLAGHSGNARLRFRFGTDGATCREGWYVDDVTVDGFEIDASFVAEPAAPTWLVLDGARPNPIVDATTIRFDLTQPAATALHIYDSQGRLVRQLLRADLARGAYAVGWDRLNDAGQRVAPGVYFYRVESGSSQASGRVVVMK